GGQERCQRREVEVSSLDGALHFLYLLIQEVELAATKVEGLPPVVKIERQKPRLLGDLPLLPQQIGIHLLRLEARGLLVSVIRQDGLDVLREGGGPCGRNVGPAEESGIAHASGWVRQERGLKEIRLGEIGLALLGAQLGIVEHREQADVVDADGLLDVDPAPGLAWPSGRNLRPEPREPPDEVGCAGK